MRTRAPKHALKLLLLVGMAGLAGCAGGKKPGPVLITDTPAAQASPHFKVGQPYKVAGIWYYPKEDPSYDKAGIASWYGPKFHGKKTANGEIFDMNRLTAAHPTLPLPSVVQVTNLKNGRTINVRVNDRGPFAHNRIIDLSREAAMKLGYKDDGLAEVRVRYLGPASLDHAVTALGQPEAYADGTYAMPTGEAIILASNELDTVHTRIVSGPEIKMTEAVATAEDLNSSSLEAARASVRKTESSVVEEIVSGSGPLDPEEPVTLPDFNEVMDVMGASPADELWLVQVGAYSETENAEKAAANFGQTIPVHREQIVNSDGNRLTLIRLGPYRSAQEASEALKLARHVGFVDARIVAP